jgi:hypothetical protein
VLTGAMSVSALQVADEIARRGMMTIPHRFGGRRYPQDRWPRALRSEEVVHGREAIRSIGATLSLSL